MHACRQARSLRRVGLLAALLVAAAAVASAADHLLVDPFIDNTRLEDRNSSLEAGYIQVARRSATGAEEEGLAAGALADSASDGAIFAACRSLHASLHVRVALRQREPAAHVLQFVTIR